MIPRIELATARVPGGAGVLRLMRRGDEYSIMLGANELMNSRLGGSEEALARLGCGPVAGRAASAVLVGGLGMGFTLRAALSLLGSDAAVTVAELVPEVVAWARGPLAAVFAGCLDDPRVRVEVADVVDVIGARPAGFDAILLDVDNGPDGLTSEANDRLYGMAGLLAARRALRPLGVLAVWSAAPDRRFAARLREARFGVEEVKVRAARGAGGRHVVWVATAGRAAAPERRRPAGGRPPR